MAVTKFDRWLYLSVATLLGILTCSEGFVCPDAEALAPCGCFTNSLLSCTGYGSRITQEDVDKALSLAKEFNNGVLDIPSFKIDSSIITHLNITPFLGGKFGVLTFEMHRSYYLTDIVGPDPDSNNLIDSIEVSSLKIYRNGLTNEGLGKVLKYFNSTKLTSLNLAENMINGGSGYNISDGSGDMEFLPGLSRFSKLVTLNLAYNSITELGGGLFKRNRNLGYIYLDSNKLADVAEDGFIFDAPDSSNPHPLEIDLGANRLWDGGLRGLRNTKRAAEILLENNFFTTISEENFQTFLLADPDNVVFFANNFIFCDASMKWVKDQRETLEYRLRNLNCVNDPGKTVFTTDLIS